MDLNIKMHMSILYYSLWDQVPEMKKSDFVLFFKNYLFKKQEKELLSANSLPHISAVSRAELRLKSGARN